MNVKHMVASILTGALLLAGTAQATEIHYGYTSLPNAKAARIIPQRNFTTNKLVKFYPGYWSVTQSHANITKSLTSADLQKAQIAKFYPGFYSLPNKS